MATKTLSSNFCTLLSRLNIRVVPLLAPAALLSAMLLSSAIAPFAYAIPTPISSPFEAGSNWFVCQGYNNPRITHTNTYALALDFSGQNCDNSAVGASLRAPLSGTVYYYDEPSGSLCINSTDGRSITLAHINSTLKVGEKVRTQQYVGAVAKPGARSNAGFAHLHLQMWSTPNCSNSTKQIPFSDASAGRICGAPDMTVAGPDLYRNGTWSGTAFTAQDCNQSRYDAGVYHVFAGAESGKKYEAYWSKGSPTVTGNYASLDAAIVDMNFERSSDGYYHTYAATKTGRIYESYWTKGQPMVTGLSTQVKDSITSLYGVTTSDKFMHLFFGTDTGKLYESYWYPGRPGTTTGQFADVKEEVTDIKFLQDTAGTYHTFIATVSGKIHHAQWGQNTPFTIQERQNTGHTITAIDAVITDDQKFRVFIATNKGAVQELSWSPGSPVASATLANVNGAPTDINFELTNDGVHHLYSGTDKGSTYETYWSTTIPLTTELVLQNIGPVASIHGLTTNDGIRHIFAGTNSGDVYESYWHPGSGQIVSGKFMNIGSKVTSTTFVAT